MLPSLKSPATHALLHAAVGIVVGALAIALQDALSILSSSGTLDLATILKEVALVFVIALGHGIFRYFEASGDPAYKFVATAADQLLTKVEDTNVPNGTKGEMTPPATK